MIRRALISVSDKTGLIELGKALKHFQVEILTTGGTAKVLQNAEIPHVLISDYTGFPEMMDGRLKTLHPKIYGGLLGRRENAEDQAQAKMYGIDWIDLVVVNLYPFQAVAAQSKKPNLDELIENIDIGGVTLLRAAAKNHRHVTVLTEPSEYPRLIQKMKENTADPFDAEFRYEMAVRAFRHCAIYDSSISSTLSQYKWNGSDLERKKFATYHSLHGKLVQELRYGENPHQPAALYRIQDSDEKSPLSESLQGKELSFNNLLDSESAWRILSELPSNSCVIVKHNNPCGVGVGKSLLESYQNAFSADKQSAFGGIVALSGTVDSDLAKTLVDPFFEIICAESFTVDARDILQRKKNLRLILLPSAQNRAPYRSQIDIRKMTGSYLIEESDVLSAYNEQLFGPDSFTATQRAPSASEIAALRLAWVVAKNCKSNAVVISNESQTLGIGCGQVNRSYSSDGAAKRAAAFDSPLKVCASDGFFPFPDNIDILREAGISAIVQPGGSIRDSEIIDACNKANMAMIFTKVRHFLH